MNITSNVEIVKKNTGIIYAIVNGQRYVFNSTDSRYTAMDNLYNALRNSYNRDYLWNSQGEQMFSSLVNDGNTTVVEVEPVADNLTPDEKLSRGLTNLIKFFSEFNFEPNYRFTNTLGFKVSESKSEAKEYIRNYFALIDNSYANEIEAKMKSREFSSILDDIAAIGKPNKTVNNRFKVYYGSAGTGKTTLAQQETDNRCVVCNASMLPSDLMEDFIFVEGKPSFKPSVLWDCMTNGQPIVLDEINLLPFDSLRFLQGILDGKKEFDYKGHKVTINDGFQIIGTMNLTIGGMTFGLPEPLVDRSSDMKKFVLSSDMLKGAFN